MGTPASKVGVTLAAALAPAVWGSTYLVTTEMLPAERPLLTAALRALPVGLLLVLVFGRLPKGGWWWRSFVLGALNIGVFFALLFVAAYRLPGGVAATAGAVQPLFVAALAGPLLGERLSASKVVAGALGVAGIALLVLRAEAALDAAGVAAALAGAASMATGVVLTKRWVGRLGRPAPLFVFTAWQLVAGGAVLAVLALAIEGSPPRLTAENGVGFLYLGVVGTALAYALWFRGIERLSASATSFLGLVSPLVASVLGFVVLGQAYTTSQGAGVALVLAAVLLGQITGRRRGGGGAGGQTGTRTVDRSRSAEHRASQPRGVGEYTTAQTRTDSVGATSEKPTFSTMAWAGYPARSAQTLAWSGYPFSHGGR